MIKRLEKLSSEVVDENPYWQYKRDRYTFPNGKTGDYFYASTRGSVFIIPRLDDGRFVLLNQFRYLNQRECIEFPGGGMKESVDALQQAKDELREEAGFAAGSWKFLGVFNPMNGVTNELCHVFLAEKLNRAETQFDDSEYFEETILSEAEIESAIAQNTIWDGMTLAAWALYKASVKSMDAETKN